MSIYEISFGFELVVVGSLSFELAPLPDLLSFVLVKTNLVGKGNKALYDRLKLLGPVLKHYAA